MNNSCRQDRPGQWARLHSCSIMINEQCILQCCMKLIEYDSVYMVDKMNIYDLINVIWMTDIYECDVITWIICWQDEYNMNDMIERWMWHE